MHTRRSPNRNAPGKFAKLVVWRHMPEVLALRQSQAQPMLASAAAMFAACYIHCAACTRLSPEKLASGKFARFVLWRHRLELHATRQLRDQQRLALAAT